MEELREIRGVGTATPLRLTGRYGAGRAMETVNSFGETVDLVDEDRLQSPVRVIPVTDAMRRADERQQRERAAAAKAACTWKLKPELRVENLLAVKTHKPVQPQKARPGRVAATLGRVRVAMPSAPKRQASLGSRSVGSPRKSKACRWCGEVVLGFNAHRAHEGVCPKRVVTRGGSRIRTSWTCAGCGEAGTGVEAERAHRKVCSKRSEVCPKCARPTKANFTAALCGQCHSTAKRKAKRQNGQELCEVCGVKLFRLTLGGRCDHHKRKPTTIPNHSDEELRLNEAWKALSIEEKQILLECLAVNVAGADEAEAPSGARS